MAVSEPLMFGVTMAAKAQVMPTPNESEPAHRPFNCILFRLAVPSVAAPPAVMEDVETLRKFSRSAVFPVPETKTKEVAALYGLVALPVYAIAVVEFR